jgi:hypothetical protein
MPILPLWSVVVFTDMVPPKIRANDDVSESAIAAGTDDDMGRNLPHGENANPVPP